MKTAVYIEDGEMQLVLTADNDFEKSVLSSFSTYPNEIKFFEGEFYQCQGGWIKQSEIFSNCFGKMPIKSLILVAKKENP